MKLSDLVQSRIRTAGFVDDAVVRRILGGLKDAGIQEHMSEDDVAVANAVLDRFISQPKRTAKVASSVALCPRCQHPMLGVKFATDKDGKYCTACRVATL